MHTENFTLTEVETLQDILLSKFNIDSNLRKSTNVDTIRGYAIRISSHSFLRLRDICVPHVYSSLMYKLGY